MLANYTLTLRRAPFYRMKMVAPREFDKTYVRAQKDLNSALCLARSCEAETEQGSQSLTA